MRRALDDFLTACGWGEAVQDPLKGDASNRRYVRLKMGDQIAIAMDAPPQKGEDTRPFIGVTTWLRDQGYSAPEILGADAVSGYLLLEDLGPDLFKPLCEAQPELERTLYEAAVDLLIDSAAKPAPARLGAHPLPDYDLPTYLREARLIVEWYALDADSPEFDALITVLCGDLPCSCVVQRDFHAENLIWLPKRDSLRQVGLLDYQDALRGHPAYDLVSLLEDARRDTALDLQEAMLSRFIAGTGANDADFRRDYPILGAQRNLKILGIFARLAKRDHKPVYLGHLPRVWAHLMHDLSHPALSELRKWVENNLPAPSAAFIDALRAEASA